MSQGAGTLVANNVVGLMKLINLPKKETSGSRLISSAPDLRSMSVSMLL